MKQRLALLIVWLIGYLASLLFLLAFLAKDWMLRENFGGDFASTTALFAPYLTPIIAFWFARRSKKAEAEAEPEPFYIALVISGIYTVIELAVIASVFFKTGEGLIEQQLDLAKTIGAGMAFLVGPAIGYFFSKSPRAS